ncbi:uncharacterized protein B0P05DRAFT_547326 [Gilbertella persicaria]|uniref:Uncharacterized protein n=1 Tax=Rhizopus stolonifer TaxID=4846 RepID=A0A367KSB1_RHIST|nr:uncharacterized protein B0P05DRAFT_547326 [Gilbertella persicaria]KAI8075385.1 hypothetical protein B0P05DRAFT_547326 [Gilbertella persicaria]RCI05027.1 hypothetical protein CU098_013275 [Rhizopus stolonifer]
MNYFISPPSSPTLGHRVICGECDKPLAADWFCADCHKKCSTCNRFLGLDEYCTRCWTLDPVSRQLLPKYAPSFSGLPSPTHSTQKPRSS